VAEGEGRRYDQAGLEAVDRQVLRALDFAYPGSDTRVEYADPEFTSVCPWTGLPDFGELVIRYLPDRKLVELKSLKYYLHSYRNVGVLQEHAVNAVLEDLVRLLAPRRMEVEGRFRPRGGLSTVVTARYPAET
jgi:7-cyano-7-deazaguanine reductase